jgi:hypothetical protein
MEHVHHAVVSGRLAGENNTGKEMWMKNCSALLPSAFFVVLSVRNRVNILFHGVFINYLFSICLCTILNINVQIIYRTVDVMSWCCRLPYRWRLGRSLVYGCLLGMVDTKASRRRHTTQPQHSQKTVTTLRHTITTPPRLQSITPKLMLPRVTSSNVLHRGSQVLKPPSHRSITRMLPQLAAPRPPSS